MKVDVLEGKTLKADCLDKGSVELIDAMPRLVEEGQTCDIAVVEAARKSYGDGTKRISDDRTLIRYLVRHEHYGPVEFCVFKFLIKAPLFVCRQLFRTRIASYDELSARYSEMPDEFHLPQELRLQSKANKQGSDGRLDDASRRAFLDDIDDSFSDSHALYKELLNEGVSREQARIVLPASLYTTFYWSINLSSLSNFLDRRCDPSAQAEIGVFANAILGLIQPLIPHFVEAWNDYSPYRNAVTLTRLEAEAIRSCLSQMGNPCPPEIDSPNKREKDEAREKFLKLGFAV